jgi:hypothetical protein
LGDHDQRLGGKQIKSDAPDIDRRRHPLAAQQHHAEAGKMM